MTPAILCVDCGLRKAGTATFYARELQTAGLALNKVPGRGAKAWLGMLEAIEAVTWRFEDYEMAVVETMQIDGRGAPPADLLELNGIAGCVIGRVKYGVSYTPKQWKGSLPKGVHHKRVLKELTSAERAVLGTLSKQKDVMDAVALGLFHTGRLK